MRGVTKIYKRGSNPFVAVDGVDFDVYPGETVGLIGESGSGKSTIGRMMLMLIEPNSGSVVFDGKELTTLKGRALRAVRTDLQVVFQEPYESLNPFSSVRECVADPLECMVPRPPKAERDRLVLEALERVGIAEFIDRYPSQLSGGQQQRVGIARAIVVKPKLIVLDEPTSSLDLSVRAGILDLLIELQAELGVSYVFISHDLSTIEYIADRIVVLRNGIIVEEGETISVISDPHQDYTQALLDARLDIVPPPLPVGVGPVVGAGVES